MLLLTAEKLVVSGFDIFIKVLGPVLIILALSLIGGVAYVFLAYIVPIMLETSVIFAALTTSFGLWILFNLVFNYYYCVMTNPGYLDMPQTSNTVEADPMLQDIDVEVGRTAENQCKKCQAEKPARAHHCQVCKRCVLAMDHHCPWMANCVGFMNYRYFFLFLHYMFWGCLFVVLVTSPLLVNGGYFISDSTGSLSLNWRSSSGAVMFPFTMCLAVGFAVSLLYSWHIYLVLSGQTTIEFYQNQMKRSQMARRGEVFSNRFDQGRVKNFQAVFGKGRYWFSWMLPRTSPPGSDGRFTHFKTEVDESLFERSDKII